MKHKRMRDTMRRMGRAPKSAEWETQSVLLPKDEFTLAEARAWAKDHDYRTKFRGKGVDETEDFYRFRQHDPGRYRGFRTLPIGRGIRLVRGWR